MENATFFWRAAPKTPSASDSMPARFLAWRPCGVPSYTRGLHVVVGRGHASLLAILDTEHSEPFTDAWYSERVRAGRERESEGREERARGQ
jgi:hypothetical protein